MATLNNTRISDTYFGLIKTIDNAVISATLKQLTDGSGNATGLYINNAGDFKVNSVLEFGSLKDTGENIVITKFVDQADGIANNNNDTSIPTSKAVKDYVDTHVTAQDLDFKGDDNAVAGDVDLDSESFQILGTANEIETAVVSAGGTQLRIGIVTNPTLSGNVTITGDLNISQGEIINIGSNFDLYATASGEYIQYGTNPVIFNGNADVIFRKQGSEEKTAVFTPQGSAKLYHNNNLKLETTVNGLNVTGKISNLTDPTANQDAATKAYVDSLDAGSDLDFGGDSGTGDVNLNAQTFLITGTSNQITTSASGQELTLSLPSTVHRNLQGNVTGNLTGNVTGNVTGDITGVGTLSNGSTAITQSAGDNSTKIATTAYVDSLDAASDLDFGGDSGTGAVVLNTQTFSIIGTANEVETSASNQQLQIGLPSSINVNSASATILQTARDISLTGEASATISSFNGSSNVSGAVTLDNNSVTGKVLTGLASPTASNILASDTILQAFGKAQSQINTLAGGLRFMGTWNANTNTPTLQSGGGEADSGTTTGTATNKLIDSSQNFTSTVTNGDKVINQASGSSALVTNVDSNTQLTLDADIMVSGQEYTIDNSPFITQGHYFVVSVGGTSSLNGLSNWAVGDWVIAGAGNVWEKLDHTQVDGTGTAGNITKWSSTNVIADSIMAESGSTITVTGGLTTTQNLLSEGTLSVYGNATIGDNFGDNHIMNGQLIQTSTESIGMKLSRRNGTTGLLISSTGDSNVQFGTDNGSGSNTDHWTIGKDNSDNAFRISAGSVLGTGDKIKITGSSTTSYQDFVMGGNDIKFADNGHVYLGDSNDLDLYHDSSNSYIKNNIGSLLIQNTNDDYHVIIQSDNGGGGLADYFRAKGDTGEAILYHYGNEKLITKSTGISVTGNISPSGSVLFNDNLGINFGNSNAKIYGSSSDGIKFNGGGAEVMRLTQTGLLGLGSASPSSYNSRGQDLVIKKTGKSTGISIIAEPSGGSNYSSSVLFGDGTGGTAAYRGGLEYDHHDDTLAISAAAVEQMVLSDNLIVFPNAGVNELRGDISSDKFAIGNMGDASSQMMVSSRGFLTFNVSNTGSAKSATERMRIDSSGNLGLGTNNPEKRLHVKTSTNDANPQVLVQNAGSGDASMTFNVSGQSYIMGIDFDDSKKFKIAASGNLGTSDKLTLLSSGNLGLGTINPQNKFVVANGTNNTQNIEIAPNYIQSFNRQSGSEGYASLNFYAQSYVFNQGNATFAQQIATQTGGFSTTTNVNSTGDAGVNIANGCRLGFDQSGTRSWTFKAYGGNFNLDSGDGNGKFSTGTKGINAGDIITVNKSASGAEGGGLLLRNASGGSGAFNRIYFAPTASDYTTRSAIIEGQNTDGNNNMSLIFKTSAGANPTEKMRIDNNGNVTIQKSGLFVGNDQTSGVTEFKITNKDTSLVDAGDIQNRITMRGLYYDQSASLIVETNIVSGHESSNGNGNSFLGFYTQSGGSSPTEKVRIASNGVLSAANGIALGVGLNNTASNVLDDYEEGTWTPVIKDLSGNQATLSVANGTYRKIGSLVVANYNVQLSSKGSMTGNYVHLTVPFTHPVGDNGTGIIDKFNNMNTAVSGLTWDTTSTAGVVWLMGVVGTSATSMSYLTPAALTDTTKFKGTIIYHT